MTEFQNPIHTQGIEKRAYLFWVIEYWNLEFVYDLVLVI